MPVTFNNNNEIIVYALECVIAHARRTQQIFVAHCVWWLAAIIGLEQGLVSHIDRLQDVRNPSPSEQLPREVSTTPKDLAKDQQSGQALAGQINKKRKSKKSPKGKETVSREKQMNFSKTEGINNSEISRRKAAGECLCCAWPCDRKGRHQVKDCKRQIKLDKGTALYPKGESQQRPVVPLEEGNLEDSSDSKDSATTDNSEIIG